MAEQNKKGEKKSKLSGRNKINSNPLDSDTKDLFIKPDKKKVKLTLMILSVIILVLIAYFSFINFRFTIKEDLVIEIPDRYMSLEITQETPAELKIYSTIQTSALCRAACTQKLVSINSNEVVFSEEFEFKRFYKVSFEKTIYPYTSGEGQDLYSYSISCTTIATANCPAKENNIQKNTIITVTRNLTEKEKIQKKSQEAILNHSYFVYNNGLFLLDSSDYILNQLNYTKKEDIENNLRTAQAKKEEYKNLLYELKDAWLTYNHSFTEQKIQNTNFISSTEEFRESSTKIYNDTINRVKEHNDAVYKTYLLAEEIQTSYYLLLQSRQFLKENYETLNSELEEASYLLSFSSRKIQDEDFSTYKEIFDSLNGGNISVAVFKQDYLDYMNNNSLFSKAQLDLLLSEEDNCLIAEEIKANNTVNNTENNTVNITINSTISNNKSQNNITINNTAENISCAKDFSNSLIDYSNISFNDLGSNITIFCENYNIQIKLKETISEERNNLRINLSNSSLLELNNESAKFRIYNLKKHREELLSRNDYSANSTVRIIDKYIQNIESEYGLFGENISENSFNHSLLNLFLPVNFTFENITMCESEKINIILNLSYENYNPPNFSSASADYNSSLPELLPRACYDGKCKPYLKNSSTNYPLIIVHGHGFYSQNFRITPSDVHNDFQNQLFSDKLYVPAGTLRENDFVSAGSLGFVDAPFVYKAAYYPEEVLNNESINLFADRLNRIILKAKQETGKDKVIIIAHSMGGIVTRTYLKKYGTNNVDSVIIAGTPNYGISSDTVALCKLFGRNLECDEMYEKSVFITELKNESNYTIPIYTLRGEGCSTFGDDGDGVVQSKKVPLPYAENFAFNSTCSLTGAFHVNLLNPKKNPDIYTKIKEILTEKIN